MWLFLERVRCLTVNSDFYVLGSKLLLNLGYKALFPQKVYLTPLPTSHTKPATPQAKTYSASGNPGASTPFNQNAQRYTRPLSKALVAHGEGRTARPCVYF